MAMAKEKMEKEGPKISMVLKETIKMGEPPAVKVKDKTFAARLEAQRIKDQEMVVGLFDFYERSGGTLKFPYRKYKGPIIWYTLKDKEVERIPRGLANHLNEYGWYPVHEHKLDANGKPSVMIGTKVKRFGFHSLDFKNDFRDFGPSKVVTVQREF